MNMGIAPFNIATSVILITAQRLARKLCPNCKRPADIPKRGAAARRVHASASWTAAGPRTCTWAATTCKNTGYKGRVGIYQVMPISEEINRIIMKNGNAIDIAAAGQAERASATCASPACSRSGRA